MDTVIVDTLLCYYAFVFVVGCTLFFLMAFLVRGLYRVFTGNDR